MSDLPVPNAGGSYLRDDATGTLTLLEGPQDVLAVSPEPPAETMAGQDTQAADPNPEPEEP